MKTNDMLLISGGLIAAYLLLKPKTTVVTTHPILPGATPTSNTGQLITTGGNLLSNLFGNIFDSGDDTPAPAPTPGTPAASSAGSDFFSNLFGNDTGADDWGDIA